MINHLEEMYLFVVNYGSTQGQCRVLLDNNYLDNVNNIELNFNDLMADKSYKRSVGELRKIGLYIDLPMWGFHVFLVGIFLGYKNPRILTNE